MFINPKASSPRRWWPFASSLAVILLSTVSIIASTKTLQQYEPCADSRTPKESGGAVLGLAAWSPRVDGKLQVHDKTLQRSYPAHAQICKANHQTRRET